MESEQVDIIASGYEWICPNCGRYNTCIETLEHVQCKDCQREYEVGEVLHAIG